MRWRHKLGQKVPTPAAPDATSSGVAAPTGAEYVVPGQIAHADCNFLFEAADAKGEKCARRRGRGLSVLAGDGLEPPGGR